jgi:hypothetical protein
MKLLPLCFVKDAARAVKRIAKALCANVTETPPL